VIDESSPWTPWQNRLAAARRRREDLVSLWQGNVDARRGKPTETSTGTDTAVNQDWPLTKAKIAQLYSQTPQVRLTPKDPAFQVAVPVFAKALNDALDEASVGAIVEEVLADVVNASGIGAALVSCERLFEAKVDPVTGETVPLPVDSAFPVRRISPADLLTPADFTGSNYDHARWLAHDDRMTWEQAQRDLGLTEDQKDTVLGADQRVKSTQTLSTDTSKFQDTEVVNYTELFYWRHYYHPEETSFKALQRVVFVHGLDAPVIDEPYKGQARGAMGLVGVMKNPIRVLTLTYISDDSLPPSDSSIGRFDVEQLTESREDAIQQRKHSIPIRWFDSNRVSPNTRSLLEKGTFQGFIPTNGPGDRAIGEVARANYPQEKFEFDRILKNDLTEIYQVGTNQAGAFASGERSASEANIIQKNFQIRIGQEQDKTTKFFLGIAEVLAGHLALYGDIDIPELSPEAQARLATWDRQALANAFVYSIRADGTVRLDANQRIEQLTKALNLTAQSGYINPKAVIAEIWELSGVDPAKVVIDPQPKAPEPVRISIGSAEDIVNPVMLSTLFRTGQVGSPEDLAAAMKMLQQAALGGMPLVPPTPAGPEGPPQNPQTPEGANPDWESGPRIDRRAEDYGA
jgi:hypothetical protein